MVCGLPRSFYKAKVVVGIRDFPCMKCFVFFVFSFSWNNSGETIYINR
jgi:hypothetical protein